MKNRTAFFLIGLTTWLSCQRLEVEYPSYPKTPEGKELRHFLKGVRVVGLSVEKPTEEIWGSDIDASQAFIRIVPAKIFEAFSEDSYFKMIDLSKQPDLLNEMSLSLIGITENRAKFGELSGAEALLYINVAKPVSECSEELRPDYWAIGILVLQAAASANSKSKHGGRYRSHTPSPQRVQNSDPIMKMTGVRKITLPIEATLVRIDTGESKSVTISKASTIYNSPGAVSCPAMLDSLSQALTESIPELEARLSPKIATEKIRIFTEDEDPEVASYLEEGYLEIKGETPSFHRAKSAWEKADAKASGKCWAAKANLATYYFSRGDFEKASELYESAAKLNAKKEKYLRDLGKTAASAADSDGE
ncbi:lipoprotein LipL41 [Leptospira fluminis]|uniref:Lipoprotein LipL41 n=1 Tax=Leptospira fluminis TaxID=2484979 RepID=A0A4R9GTB6_9LEPT|nr:lipoprotein LipL41 [Leptospira fluminis]TGK20777.1 lipoprotein LipL41 [Leptospira fluminis]